ncbi:MAG: PD40 domain-containing protein [Phycisphaerales bacterium]|nr:MAG: PD40 domain-containing protein [Phycisphaerales bacterium]
MRETFDYERNMPRTSIFLCLWLCISSFAAGIQGSQLAGESQLPQEPCDKSEIDLKAIPFKIIYETYRETDGEENWELFLIDADGSNATNLTRTPDVHEMYPHASPDGTKVCFVVDEGTGRNKSRNVYYMNIDGTGRVKVAENARQPCWSPDGKMIAYTEGEYERFTTRAIGAKGLFFYDLATGKRKQHPNRELHHIYSICWSADGDWFIAIVTGGMGFSHNIIAFEAHGTAVFDLSKYGIDGCRPDLSPNGEKATWGQSDWDLYVADIDLTLSVPRVADIRGVVKCRKGYHVSHTDLSPDGRYVAFGYGPALNYSVGVKAPDWDICVGDLTGKWVKITTDGKHSKEPDWVLLGEGSQ